MALFFLILWASTVTFMTIASHYRPLRDWVWDVLMWLRAYRYLVLEKLKTLEEERKAG